MADGSYSVRDQNRQRLFDTSNSFDAGLAGYDGPADVAEGGFKVFLDTNGAPSVEIQTVNGDAVVTGYAAIQRLADALMDAERALRARFRRAEAA